MAPELLAELSTLAHPPRVLGVYRRDDLPRGTRPLGLALWRVHDPGNVGTLLRTADAFGASGRALERVRRRDGPEGAARVDGRDLPRPDRAVRGGTAAARRARLARGTPLAELDPGDVTFVLGAEREALPDDVLRDCDALATIRCRGEQADSLNVAAAGAVALYESIRASPPVRESDTHLSG